MLCEVLMFGAEIPVSGRVLDYQVKNGRIQPGDPDDSDGEPLHIVGQLNALKLWQDVPDALFDEEEYTVFCRVEETYDEESWHPLSLAQKIETVSAAGSAINPIYGTCGGPRQRGGERTVQ